MKLYNKIYNIIRAYDPTGGYFVTALIWTLPNLTGVLFYMVSRRPLSFIIFYIPSTILLISTYSLDYKNKIFNMILYTLILAGSQLAIAILYHHKTILTVVLFLIILFIFSSIKRRYIGIIAPCWIAIFLNLQPGWYNGFNRIIDCGLSLLIAIMFLFLFEYFTSRFIMRSSIIYISELIYDSFVCYTTNDRDRIESEVKNKLLYNSRYFNRSDILVENIFKNRRDKFYHKITLAKYKVDMVIDSQKYFFKKNIMYAVYVKDVYVFYLKMFRAIGFMRYYYSNNKELNYYVPLTNDLINNINHRLKLLSDMIKERRPPEKEFRDSKLIDNWKYHLDEFCKKKYTNITDDELEFFFGLKCLLEDLDMTRNKLNLRYGII